jgi:hypothetical protein
LSANTTSNREKFLCVVSLWRTPRQAGAEGYRTA